MRFLDLEPRFTKLVEGDGRPGQHMQDVDTLAEAQGVWFLCPVCFKANGGSVGTHSILCWFLGRGVPDGVEPGPGRWEALGAGVDDITFRAGSSSILLRGGCNAHFFIRDGEVIPC